jgi:hypothetical protein
VGGARIRMKLANASMSERTAVFELPVAEGAVVKLSVSSGVALKRQPGGLVALLREELVRDSHLDVVGFAREHEEGFVLRFPAETGDGPIICTEVHISAQVCVCMAGDTQGRFIRCIVRHIRKDG